VVAQVTKDQHFVPEFYLERFADNGIIQVLHLRARRIGKPRPYQSVCYKKFFYAQKTGVEDEVSQHVEAFFGAIESQIAERLPAIIEHAESKTLSNVDLDTLAYMMSLQWMRTARFRNVVQSLASHMLKFVSQATARFPGFIEDAQRFAMERGIELSSEAAEQLREYLAQGEYSIKTDNSMHLRFLASRDNVVGVHNLFFHKQWNVWRASGRFRFITSDNPVAEWLPSAGIFGNSFLERKHYFPLTPDIMIESVYPDEDEHRVSPAETVEYRTCDADGVLVFDMVMAQHAHEFAYGASKDEFQQLLWQAHKPGAAMTTFREKYGTRPV
jgi:hypothetical protein